MATHSSIPAWKSPKDKGAWWATVHGVAKSWTQPNDWTTSVLSLYGQPKSWFRFFHPLLWTNPNLLFSQPNISIYQPNEKSKGCWFKACSSNRISHQHLSSGRDSKASRGVGKLPSGKQQGFLSALTRGSCPGEAGGGHPKLVGSACLAFSCWILSWILSWTKGNQQSSSQF